MRTTIDIDSPLLAEVKALGKREGKSLGRIVSDFLASALAVRKTRRKSGPEKFSWVARPMRALGDHSESDGLPAAWR